MSLRQNARPLALEALAAAQAAQATAAAAGTPTRMWLSAERFYSTGAPGRTATGWLFDAAADETVTTTIALPAAWTFMQLDLYLRGVGPDAGDVVMRAYFGMTPYTHDAGVPVPVAPWGTSVVVESGGTGVVKVAANVIGTITVPDSDPHELWVGRKATDALDTLPIDFALVGVMLRGA